MELSPIKGIHGRGGWGGVGAGQAGKEVGEDRGSRYPLTSGKGTRTRLWISFSFKGKGRHRGLGTAAHKGYTKQGTAGPLPRLEQSP